MWWSGLRGWFATAGSGLVGWSSVALRFVSVLLVLSVLSVLSVARSVWDPWLCWERIVTRMLE